MNPQLLAIVDDKIVIDKVQLKWTEGQVTHLGNFDVRGKLTASQPSTFESDVAVKGQLAVDTLIVKHLISESPTETGFGQWAGNTEEDITEKGLFWTSGNTSSRLVYAGNKKIFADAHIDLSLDSTYKIHGATVLSATALGGGVSSSNLRKLGRLEKLAVDGDTNLGDFAFFNTVANRLGLGTEEPTHDISIVSNNVEIGIGSPRYGLAVLGAVSNHDVSIITDNIPRITVKNNGEVIIGDLTNRAGVLKIYGTLQADSIVSDTRVERSSSLTFVPNLDTSVYGKGLVWAGGDAQKELVLRADPDRITSTLPIDVAVQQSYMIDGTVVLTAGDLGVNVTRSNLSKLGVLESLTVQGDVELRGNAGIDSLSTNRITIANDWQINSQGLQTRNNFKITSNSDNVLSIDNQSITISSVATSNKIVRIFGRVGIGMNQPDDSVKLDVNGPVKFDNKKFINNGAPPTTGIFMKGDICWNTNPEPGNYIGWVCVVDGTPGQWAPFGQINTQ
jgi:hypothetical protein